jgi:hypothetical protein
MDFKKLHIILENGTKTDLENFCSENNLVIRNEKIFHKNANKVRDQIEYWDKRQLVKKINLNS